MTEIAAEQLEADQSAASTEADNSALPSNHEILEDAGMSFHLFIDSAEGVSLPLDAERAETRADSSRKRLLGAPTDPSHE